VDRTIYATFLAENFRPTGRQTDRVLGLLMNTLPVRIRLSLLTAEQSVVHAHQLLAELSDHEHASLAFAQRCSDVPAPAPLFTSLLNYRYTVPLKSQMVKSVLSGVRGLGLEERSSYPLVMTVDDLGEGLELIVYALNPIAPEGVFATMKDALELLVRALEQNPRGPVPMLDRVAVEKQCRAAEPDRRSESLAKATVRGNPSVASSREPNRSAVLPQTLEDTLAGIFAEILDLGRFDAHKSFFAEGGNSLHALRLAIRIHTVLDINLPIRLVFENPTPAQLARKMREHVGEEHR
jgi:hypothetical protein